jgi:hypothetical protein
MTRVWHVHLVSSQDTPISPSPTFGDPVRATHSALALHELLVTPDDDDVRLATVALM